MLAEVEQAVEVGAPHGLPVVQAHLAQALVARDAGVVDQHVDMPELGVDLLYHPLAFRVVADVDLVGDKAEARVFCASSQSCARSLSGENVVATRNPAVYSRRQIAAPSPPMPPVTKATFLLLLIFCSF